MAEDISPQFTPAVTPEKTLTGEEMAIVLGSSLLGGFAGASDYIKDTKDSFGMASTVTAADDVRFWAGASFANRATAPFRVYESGAIVAQSATIAGVLLNPNAPFGGSGVDGALSITSGTTTINLGGAQLVVKNYTSISITGTGSLAFSNPHANGTIIHLKSQGAVTITSSATRAIDLRSLGAAAGTGGATQLADGTNGTQSVGVITGESLRGLLGHGTGSAGGASVSGISSTFVYAQQYVKSVFIFPGSGGAGGGAGQNGDGANFGVFGAGANGGRGAGALYIECKGAWNFTGTIGAEGANGSNGSNGTDGGSASAGGGGGGGGSGGSGGMVYVLYNTLTANSGTITVTGGNGGNGGNGGADGGAGSGGVGGGGASGAAGYASANGAGGAGGSGGAAGTPGSSASSGGTGGGAGNAGGGGGARGSGGGGGGGGSNGYQLVEENNTFA